MLTTSLRLVLSALVGLCIGPLIGFQGPASASEPAICAESTICRLWVSSSGDDSNDGRSEARPLRSLQRANDLLCQQTEEPCTGIGKGVKVTIAAGTYPNARTVWSYSDPSYATQIVGLNVVMDGRHSTRWGLGIMPENDRSNVQVFYIKWTRYLEQGIVARGGSHNRIYKNTFTRIGSYYSKRPEYVAYSGVSLIDTKYASVERSVFSDILNTGSGYSHEHGVYLYHSTNNRVIDSTFLNVGGDPIRVRHSANDNTITRNVFANTGSLGYIGDWRCVTSCPNGPENLSWRNSFKDNDLRGPHPWHFPGFKARFCYDLRGWCTSQRIAG